MIFKIPVPVDKPDANGVMCSVDAIKKDCEQSKNQLIEFISDNEECYMAGFCNRIKFLEDECEIQIDGVIGYDETKEIKDIVKNIRIMSFLDL